MPRICSTVPTRARLRGSCPVSSGPAPLPTPPPTITPSRSMPCSVIPLISSSARRRTSRFRSGANTPTRVTTCPSFRTKIGTAAATLAGVSSPKPAATTASTSLARTAGLTGPTTDTPAVLKNGNWHNVVVSFQRAPFGSSAFVYGYLDGALVTKHPIGHSGHD